MKKPEDLTYIKAKPQSESLKITEVQNEMNKIKSNIEEKKNEWINPELIKKLNEAGILQDLLTDPEMGNVKS